MYRCLGALGSLHTSIPAECSADLCCVALTGAQTGSLTGSGGYLRSCLLDTVASSFAAG